MNLLILYHLLNDLSDEKCCLEASMLTTDDPALLDDLKHRVRQLIPLLAEIPSEILARELPCGRSTVTAQAFETHVHRVLSVYGSMEPVHREEIQPTASRAAATHQERKHEQEVGRCATTDQCIG